MALGPRGKREQFVARQRAFRERVARHETADPRGGARAEAARRRDAIDAADRDALERPSRGLEGQAHATRDDVVGAHGQIPRALALHRHRHAVRLARLHVVVERQGETEGVEAGTEVGGRRRDANAHAHVTAC